MADPRLAIRMEESLRQFVNASPGGRLFVQSGENYRLDILPDTASQIKGGYAMELAVAALRGTPEAGRVILVGAANRDGTALWSAGDSGATLWTGVTGILAPSEDVLLLAYPAGVFTHSGTSYGAAMVSGVAAQLWAFDPTLTADSVRDYILRGAQEPKAFGLTGEPVPTNPIPGSGGLYLLDAYGALTLASRERSNTPICGFPVYARGANLILARDPTHPDSIPVAGATSLSHVSVAQGGRIIAVTDQLFPAGEQVLRLAFDGTVAAAPLAIRRRQYLERDTVDLIRSPVPGTGTSVDSVRLRGLGGPREISLTALLTNESEFLSVLDLEASPAGDWFSIAWSRDRPPIEGIVSNEDAFWYLVPFAQPSSFVQVYGCVGAPECPPEGLLAAGGAGGWTQDGQRLVIPINFQFTEINQAYVWNITIVNGAPTNVSVQGVVSGFFLLSPRFTTDGSTLITSEESTSGVCTTGLRDAANPTALLSAVPADPADCLGMAPTIFNARAVAGAEPVLPERRGRPRIRN